ncbi:MAG: hypothetical protein AB1589_12330 [Cyanobacteriota bacterium]
MPFAFCLSPFPFSRAVGALSFPALKHIQDLNILVLPPRSEAVFNYVSWQIAQTPGEFTRFGSKLSEKLL